MLNKTETFNYENGSSESHRFLGWFDPNVLDSIERKKPFALKFRCLTIRYGYTRKGLCVVSKICTIF